MSQSEQVSKYRSELKKAKAQFHGRIQAYLNAQTTRDFAVHKKALDEMHRAAVEYFNTLEHFIGDTDLLGTHTESEEWSLTLAEDCHEVLGTLIQHQNVIDSFGERHGFDVSGYKPGKFAYSAMQRFMSKYLPGKTVSTMKNELNQKGLPVNGFNTKTASKSVGLTATQILLFVTGALAMGIVLIFSWLNPEPSESQQVIFRIFAALGAGALAAPIPGMLHIKTKWVTAGGPMAVIVLFYLFNPPEKISDLKRNAQETSDERAIDHGP